MYGLWAVPTLLAYLGWVSAKDLHAGTLLQTKYESWLDVDRVERHGGLTTVYNFEVVIDSGQ